MPARQCLLHAPSSTGAHGYAPHPPCPPQIMSVMAALAAGSRNSLIVDALLRTLGLEECADTVVRAARAAAPRLVLARALMCAQLCGLLDGWMGAMSFLPAHPPTLAAFAGWERAAARHQRRVSPPSSWLPCLAAPPRKLCHPPYSPTSGFPLPPSRRQRKRLTTGEALTASVKVLLADEVRPCVRSERLLVGWWHALQGLHL